MKRLHSRSQRGGSDDLSWVKTTCFPLRYVCLSLPVEETSILGLKSDIVSSVRWKELSQAPDVSGAGSKSCALVLCVPVAEGSTDATRVLIL